MGPPPLNYVLINLRMSMTRQKKKTRQNVLEILCEKYGEKKVH